MSLRRAATLFARSFAESASSLPVEAGVGARLCTGASTSGRQAWPGAAAGVYARGPVAWSAGPAAAGTRSAHSRSSTKYTPAELGLYWVGTGGLRRVASAWAPCTVRRGVAAGPPPTRSGASSHAHICTQCHTLSAHLTSPAPASTRAPSPAPCAAPPPTRPISHPHPPTQGAAAVFMVGVSYASVPLYKLFCAVGARLHSGEGRGECGEWAVEVVIGAARGAGGGAQAAAGSGAGAGAPLASASPPERCVNKHAGKESTPCVFGSRRGTCVCVTVDVSCIRAGHGIRRHCARRRGEQLALWGGDGGGVGWAYHTSYKWCRAMGQELSWCYHKCPGYPEPPLVYGRWCRRPSQHCCQCDGLPSTTA